MHSWRWTYRCPKHVGLFMIINHNCYMKFHFDIWCTVTHTSNSFETSVAEGWILLIFRKTTILRNVANFTPNQTESHLRSTYFSALPLWEPQISHVCRGYLSTITWQNAASNIYRRFGPYESPNSYPWHRRLDVIWDLWTLFPDDLMVLVTVDWLPKIHGQAILAGY